MSLFSWFRQFFRKDENPICHITTEQLKEVLESIKGKQFIDVRTKEEFKAVHIREFKNFPLHNLEQNIHKINKEQEVFVICQSGGRSLLACRELKKMGFQKVINVKGGMNDWKK